MSKASHGAIMFFQCSVVLTFRLTLSFTMHWGIQWIVWWSESHDLQPMCQLLQSMGIFLKHNVSQWGMSKCLKDYAIVPATLNKNVFRVSVAALLSPVSIYLSSGLELEERQNESTKEGISKDCGMKVITHGCSKGTIFHFQVMFYYCMRVFPFLKDYREAKYVQKHKYMYWAFIFKSTWENSFSNFPLMHF